MRTKFALFAVTSASILMQAFAQGPSQDSWVYYVIRKNDQVGKILEGHGSRPLWGRGRAVERFFLLNPEIPSTKHRKLKVGTKVKVPYPVVGKSYGEESKETVQKQADVTRVISSIWTSLKADLEFGVKSKYIGNSQKLRSSGVNFDSSFYSLANIYLRLGMNPSASLRAEVGLNYNGARINGRDIDTYQLKESQSSYVAPEVKLKYCGLFKNDENKLCPKFSFLVDSFYFLNFENNTELVLQRLEDMYLTYGLDWEHVFSETNTSGSLGIRYDHGLQRGQNITVDWKSNHRLVFESALRWPVFEGKGAMTISSSISSQRAEFETNRDDWLMKTTVFELSLGLLY